MLDERYSNIERENHMLLDKLKNIIKTKNGFPSDSRTQHGSATERIKSLNFRQRKNFLKDITKKNRKFLVTLNNVQSEYKLSEDTSRNSWGTSTHSKHGFGRKKKSLNRMFKIKRNNDNGKLPMINSINADHKLRNTKGIEKFSTFDSMVRVSNRAISHSPNKTNGRK